MHMLKPRSRLVYFRITEDEFQKFSLLCEAEGARSLSEMARMAIGRSIEGQNRIDPVAERLEQLNRRMDKMNDTLKQLTAFLQNQSGETPPAGENR